MMGILSSETFKNEEEIPVKPISVNTNGSLQFTIIPLTSQTGLDEIDYQETEQLEYVVGFANELKALSFEDPFRESDSIREEALLNFLKEQVIFFRPELRAGTRNSTYLVAKEITISPIKLNLKSVLADNKKNDFDILPIFRKGAHITSNNIVDFEDNLISNKVVGISTTSSHVINGYPRAIVWEEVPNEMYIYDGISDRKFMNIGEGTVKYSLDSEQFGKYILDSEYSDFYYIYQKGGMSDLLFLPVDMMDSIGQVLECVTEDINSLVQLEDRPNERSPKKLVAEGAMDKLSEEDILNRFINRTLNEGYLFEKKDLVNFYVSMKTSKLVVLAGPSGTGKSTLVKQYADALQINDEYLNFIPVQPFWSDDTNLLGYVDSVNSVYRPAESGLVDTLVSAAQNKDQIHIVCLDEMNLARVEHYFSQFLSVLEQNPKERYIRLYDSSLEGKLYNSDKYPSKVNLLENVFFIGTINLDESTHNLTNKVLDRANVIELNVMPFEQYTNLSQEMVQDTSGSIKQLITFTDFQSFKSNEADNIILFDNREIDLLWKLHMLIEEMDGNSGVGWRVFRQIDTYLKNIPNNPYFQREEAFDKQLVQRVFTKIRGSEENIRPYVGTFDDGKVKESKILNLLIEYKDVSSFDESISIINKKAKELRYNGYTL